VNDETTKTTNEPTCCGNCRKEQRDESAPSEGEPCCGKCISTQEVLAHALDLSEKVADETSALLSEITKNALMFDAKSTDPEASSVLVVVPDRDNTSVFYMSTSSRSYYARGVFGMMGAAPEAAEKAAPNMCAISLFRSKMTDEELATATEEQAATSGVIVASPYLPLVEGHDPLRYALDFCCILIWGYERNDRFPVPESPKAGADLASSE
jgi:hypothetical protein